MPHQDGDLLLGADGIHSTVRQILHPDEGAAAVERRHSLARHVAGKAVPDRAQQDCRSGADFGGSGERWIAEHKFRPDHDWRREDSNRVGDPADFLPWFADWPFGWLDVAGLIQAAEACFEYPMVARDPLDRRMSAASR